MLFKIICLTKPFYKPTMLTFFQSSKKNQLHLIIVINIHRDHKHFILKVKCKEVLKLNMAKIIS